MNTNYCKFNGLEIEYTATGGCNALTYGPPEDCYPGEAPDVEIVSVKVLNPEEVESNFGVTLGVGETVDKDDLTTVFEKSGAEEIYEAAFEEATA